MLPVRPSRRFALLALLAISAVSPLRAEAPPSKGAPLSDEEVRAWLERDELPAWNRLAAARTEAERLVARGKDMQNARSGAEFKGVGDPPEARKAKGDALMKAGQDRLVELDKLRASLMEKVAARIRDSATKVVCPELPFRDALTSGVAQIVPEAAKAGYDGVIPAGFIMFANGRGSADVSLGEFFAEAVKAAAPSAPQGGKVAIVLAELQPCEAAGGAFLSIRLLEPSQGVVIRSALLFVPTDAAKAPVRSGGRKTMIMFEDGRNVLEKLGAADSWVFDTEGDPVGACLLKTVLATRGKPAVSDRTFLKQVLRRDSEKSPDSIKASWVISPGPEPLSWVVEGRGKSPGSKPFPVGRISIREIRE